MQVVPSRLLWGIFAVLLVVGGVLTFLIRTASRDVVIYDAPVQRRAAPIDEGVSLAEAQEREIYVTTGTSELPRKVLITVPFSPQAPFANWDSPIRQEGCEEMSLIMVRHFLQQIPLARADADRELIAIAAWEEERFGYALDTSLEEVAQIAREYYGFRTRIVYDPTVEDIKREVAAGNPVIVPAYGRGLQNKYFTPPGPWYHMLVIIGYDEDEFITNDPGTKRGEGYEYSYDILMKAIHNWTGVKEDIVHGPKAMLVMGL